MGCVVCNWLYYGPEEIRPGPPRTLSDEQKKAELDELANDIATWHPEVVTEINRILKAKAKKR